ncbi:hypothetical protein U27_03811 [Candidatus Vecturithrix granuli]|uniref:Transcriptional regulator AbiEi antitoxin N-terminal domain-containing protein n=1 Tax=Vecturithrix granuli TaxID=1499967 RepID=A0A081BWZ2_VECG1|nr:hypothetical protein U27_03811 [Candidatus Vecturithrix granuli]
MSSVKHSKLHRLITKWPRGTVAVATYLNSIGITPELLYKYKQSNWLQPLGRGAYALAGDKVDWRGALYALQRQLSLNVHVGGKTAIEMKGYAHYLSESIQTVFLYGQPGQKLPAWFKKYDWNASIVFTTTRLFPEESHEGLTEFQEKEFSIRMSVLERAALEMLYHVPGKISFEEAFLIFENLMNLRPSIVQTLLESCRQIKVKRLFLSMAAQHAHPWFAQLDQTTLDLGAGKRVIVKPGTLDPTYQITIPKTTQESWF